MEKEVSTLSRVFSGAPRPVYMVLGGTKVDDSIDVARHVLAHGIADQVMVIGVVANVFLIAAGYNIGTPSTQLISQLKYQPEIEKAKEILSAYRDRVIMPESVAVRQDNHRVEYPIDRIPEDTPVLDLGMDALGTLVAALKKAGTVVFNGPAGVFEDADFASGTYELLRAASQVEFSVVGGGHTAAVIEKLGISDGPKDGHRKDTNPKGTGAMPGLQASGDCPDRRTKDGQERADPVGAGTAVSVNESLP